MIVTHGVSYVHGGSQLVVINNILNIFRFWLAFCSVTLMARKIMPYIAQFQKHFDISALAIANNKKFILAGKVAKRLIK